MILAIHNWQIYGSPRIPQTLKSTTAHWGCRCPSGCVFATNWMEVDPDWQEPGVRREAYYTRLASGNYRFEVITCNNDGMRNGGGAILDFWVAPAYYQTMRLRASCVAGVLVIISAIFQLRLRQLQRHHEALNHVRLELTHVARLSSLSTMTASITHEVSQPLSGILTNANTCARILAADPPNIVGAAETVRRTIRDTDGASEVIKHLRAMFAKKATTLEMVDLNDAAREVIALSTAELRKSDSILQTEFTEHLQVISGDRVQLRQVILNLLLNAADAMTDINNRPRALRV